MSIKFNNNIRNSSYSLPIYRKYYIVAKLAVCFLLLGLAYRLSLSSFLQFSSLVDVVNSYHGRKGSQPSSEKCNVFEGDWIPDSTPPYYTNESCRWIQHYKNCLKNGRPDTGYIYWRWKPKQCELPKLNPRRFLDTMRNTTFAFIGDSVVRNQLESLLCVLSQVEQPIEVLHDEFYHHRRWHFPSHNFTVSVLWGPLLTKAELYSAPRAPIKLHLDKLDPLWTQQLEKMDYIVIAGGKWFLRTLIFYENSTVIGCHFCPGMNLTQYGFDFAYRKSLQLAFDYINRSNHKVYTIFRTITPNHFEHGGWNNGGYCNRTKPFKAGEINVDDIDEILHRIELEEFEKAAIEGSRKGLSWKMIDATYLSVLRPDGHPGAYRKFHPLANSTKPEKNPFDCLHWCLPGPVDTWNDLMMETLSSK